jgi:F420-0:gamma-glutamyl ligase
VDREGKPLTATVLAAVDELAAAAGLLMGKSEGAPFRLKRHFSLRAFQADYYLSHFANGVNNHQNNLRIGVGLSFHLLGIPRHNT